MKQTQLEILRNQDWSNRKLQIKFKSKIEKREFGKKSTLSCDAKRFIFEPNGKKMPKINETRIFRKKIEKQKPFTII